MALNHQMWASFSRAMQEKVAVVAPKKIKSNDRMPPRTKKNVDHLMGMVHELRKPHRDEALRFASEVTPTGLFDLLHSMRRWYSGQTMGRNLLNYQKPLAGVMKIAPEDVKGVYRGFRVDRDSELAEKKPGDRFSLPVKLNHGISSWSTTEAPTNMFSGASKKKVGLIIKLVNTTGVTPLLAPQSHTAPWFNKLYEHAIGKSFRPKEGEYAILAPRVEVEVVRVKK